MNARFCAILLGIAALGLAAPAFADSRDDVLAAIKKCSALTDDKTRLACYDALVRPAEEAFESRPAPQDLARPPTQEEQQSWFGFDLSGLFDSEPPAPQTTPQQFGSDNIPPPKEKEDTAQAAENSLKEVESITAAVEDFSYRLDGQFVVFLKNGQVWRQIEGDTDRARFPKDAVVTISRGIFGSYNLEIAGRSMIYKVLRIK